MADLAALADALESEGQELLLELPAAAGERGLDSFKGLILAITLSVLPGVEQQAQEAGGEVVGALGGDLGGSGRGVGPASSSWPKICRVAAEYFSSIASSGVRRNRPGAPPPMMVSVGPASVRARLRLLQAAVLAANWSTIWL